MGPYGNDTPVFIDNQGSTSTLPMRGLADGSQAVSRQMWRGPQADGSGFARSHLALPQPADASRSTSGAMECMHTAVSK